MTNPFKEHIQDALADANLQTALDNNYTRRRDARLLSYQSLPEDIQVLRQRAHARRAEVITHLDHYVTEFSNKAAANGVVVHHAVDAAEAVNIVLEIAEQHDARLIAKAKSMVSEEIELNRAIEASGRQVVETDLGEYIVQLRGEHPAHIITPAVHLRAADVGKTFHEKLGLPMTDDIPTLTSAAQKELRQVFMQADIGISGVNFGVAQTGTYCMVTNEGNGRMVATLPPVHIALMGIERIVPTMDDLALMLYLLPRSATGQKLSVYVSLINRPTDAPAPGDYRDGPLERHVVLVDNGRRSVQKSSLAEALYCIRCGTCLNMCPVFRELGGHAYVSIHGEGSIYPGPIGSVLAPALFGQDEFGHLARASSLCGACKEGCPVDIDLPKLLLRIRAGETHSFDQAQTTKPQPNAPFYLKVGLRMFARIATSPSLYATAQRFAGLFGRVLPDSNPWLRMPAMTGWGYSKDFPRPAKRPFRDHWAKIEHQAPRSSAEPAPLSEKPAPVTSEKQNSFSAQERVSRFAQELGALGGTVISCQATEAPSLVLEHLRQLKTTRIQAWKDAELPSGLAEALRSGGIELVHQHDPAIEVGITGVQSAIAESGTLIVTSGADLPLSASLVPRVHIALLPASKIHASMAEAFGDPMLTQTAAGALITGPSRTADIEMALTVGMHGPGAVRVYCLMDA
jgi:L-lactate dehydrogenase complex protein LldF